MSDKNYYRDLNTHGDSFQGITVKGKYICMR